MKFCDAITKFYFKYSFISHLFIVDVHIKYILFHSVNSLGDIIA